MANYATRGDLGRAIYEALGITEPSSTDRFTDAGSSPGTFSTLFDLGITTGTADGVYSPERTTTRGEAFTMLARALGLAGPNDNIAAASQALVNAGIVKGYGGDPNNLGLNDPLQADHLGLLIERIQPELAVVDPDTGMSRRDSILGQVREEREREVASEDPVYAAYLSQFGLRGREIEDEMVLREKLYLDDQRRMTESYQRLADDRARGVATDFENRGLYLSGTRDREQTQRRVDTEYEREDAAYGLQRQYEETQRGLGQSLAELERQRTVEEAAAQARAVQRGIEGI